MRPVTLAPVLIIGLIAILAQRSGVAESDRAASRQSRQVEQARTPTEEPGYRRERPPRPTERPKNEEPEPRCEVDVNNFPHLRYQVDRAAYEGKVIPSLYEVILLHSRALKEYSVPFETFWNLLSLDLLFPNALHACCSSCPNNLCVEPIKFRKATGATQYADFSMRIKNATGPTVTLTHTAMGVHRELVLPVELTGFGAFTAGSASFWFSSFQTPLPKLKLVRQSATPPVVLYDGGVVCTSTLPQWAALEHEKIGGTGIPELSLLVDPK